MRHLILSVLISFLFATAAYAEDITEKVVDDAAELYQIKNAPDGLQLVNSTMSAAIYSTNDYRSGLFDLFADVAIDSHNLPAVAIDNSDASNSSYSVQINSENYIRFSRDVDVVGAYFDMLGTYANTPIVASFYDKDDNLIATHDYFSGDSSNQILYHNHDIKGVREINFTTKKSYKVVSELDFFIDPAAFYQSVSDIKSTVKDTTAKISWKNPVDNFFTGNKVYLNDVLKSSELSEDINFTDLAPETEYKITVSALYGATEVKKDYYFKTRKDITPTQQVTNLKAEQTADGILLTYDLPPDEDFSHVKIMRNNIAIANDITDARYIDTDIKDNFTYTYRLVAYDKAGNAVTSMSATVKTTSKDVTDLRAVAKSDNVKLTWTNPLASGFEDVTIYRKDKGVMAAMARTFSFDATAGYTMLFTTNGTNFTDHTVASDSTYTYLLTSTIAGESTDGVTIDVKTPKVMVEDAGVEKKENGDYLLTWTKPETGKLLVKVGGVEYKIVNAADKQLLIPGADMIYNAVGNPDVQLIAIDDDGKEIGIPSNPGGAGWDVSLDDAGLDGKNLITVSLWLIGIVMSIILLAMAFRVTPKVIDLIFGAFK